MLSGTIYGVSDSGQKISIWDAQRGKYTAEMSGQVREEFWEATWVCVGAHVPSPEEPSFVKAILVVDELYYLTDDGRFCPPQWANIEGVEAPGQRQENGTRLIPYLLPVVGGYNAECVYAETSVARYAVNTNATRPWESPATVAMPDLRLQFMRRDKRRGQVIELRVGANVSIRLPGDAAGSAIELVDHLAPILDLIRLATFSTSDVEAISLTSVDDNQVSLLSRIGEPATPDEPHQSTAVIFDFNDVSLDSYLKNRARLTNGRQADYAWSVIIGHCGYSPKFVEQYVSQVLAAAEGFHTWCLNGGDNNSLNSRLTSLHDTLPTEVQTHLGLNVDKWTEWAVWARNHVAHGGTKRKSFIKDGLQILAVAKTAHLVTYLNLLSELNVPVGRITDALNDHPRLSGLVAHCETVNQIQLPAQP